MNKFKTFAIAAAAVAGAATLGVGGIYAAQASNALPDRMNGLVTAIAQKFNLNASDVQKVFDEQRNAMQAERQAENLARLKERLAGAVKDGTITQSQSDLILAKHEEMHGFMTSLQGKTPDERKTAIDAKIVELQQWAKDNNIPSAFLPMADGRNGKGMGEGMGMGKGMGRGVSLEQAVKDGKLTQAQADLIKAKHQELRQSMNLQGKTAAERQAALTAQADALKQWAKDNGIPEEYAQIGPGNMMGKGGMGRGMHNN